MELTQSILTENDRRIEERFGNYDPWRGTGSLIPREAVDLLDGNTIALPVSCKTDHFFRKLFDAGSLEQLALTYPDFTIEQYQKTLTDLRFKHDFEFWAATCIKIQDKLSKKMVPFVLRFPQRKLLRELEDMRVRNVPIRLILLKARQWGGSTLVQIYMAWLQLFHRTRWHSAVVAEDEGQARNIRGMFTNLAKDYPDDIGSITFKPYEGSTKNRVIKEHDCIVGIGSAQKPDNLRSYDFSMLHLSEVGLWKETLGKKPEDLVQSVRATVAREPYTLIVMESTAKGLGFFHREWGDAVKGKSGYRPVFVAWFEIDMYSMPFKSDTQRSNFVDSLSDYEQHLWELGATLEGIHWYRVYKQSENYSDWRMKEEFPSTAEEAFQTSGKRYYSPIIVANARQSVCEPKYVGDLIADAQYGPKSLENIRFEPNPRGNLRIWMHPDEFVTDHPVAHRYAGYVDIGGTTEKSDWSVIKVGDRWPMIEGGDPECAAEWRGHIDPELLAWKSAQIGKWFDNMLLAVEVNALYSRGNNTDGVHYLTIFNEISNHYQNLFMREDPAKVKERKNIYGYHISEKSKDVILTTLKKAWRPMGGGWVEHSEVTVDEAAYFEIKDDGRTGAVDGEHDDSLLATAGTAWLCNDYMPAPYYIEPVKRKKVFQADAEF